MPRDKNPKKTVKIAISTTPEMAELLKRMSETGVYGQTPTSTAEILLGERIRQLFGDKILASISVVQLGQQKQGGTE